MGGITLRAVLIGLFFVILASYITPYNDYYVHNNFFAGNHLPIGSIFILIVLVLGVNVVIRAINPRKALSPVELITIWIMIAVASGIPSSGLSRYLFPVLVGPFYFATPENEWQDVALKHIPSSLVPSKDPTSPVVRYFYEGLPEGMHIPWQAWIKPLIMWAIFTLLLYFALACLCVILRKQWAERERLVFPLIKLPLEMVKAPTGQSKLNEFFSNKAVWIGIAIPVFVWTLKNLHMRFPAVPDFPVQVPLYHLFTEAPWNAIGLYFATIQFSVVGITYLLTKEVSLSLWLFYLLYRFSFVVGAILGRGGETYLTDWARFEQAGAHVAWVGFMIWLARPYIKEVFREAFRKGSGDDSEGMRYRTAVLGMFGGILGMAIWCSSVGMSFFFSLMFILFLFVGMIVLTRVVVEGGLLFVQQSYFHLGVMNGLFGAGAMSPATLVNLQLIQIIYGHDLREFIAPTLMHGLQIAHVMGQRKKLILAVMGVAIIAGLAVSFYSYLSLCYKYGAVNMMDYGMAWAPKLVGDYTTDIIRKVSEAKDAIAKGMEVPEVVRRKVFPDPKFVANFILGGAIMSFLIFMRMRFYWWPLHPIGFVMAATYPVHCIWFSIFLGWAAKSIIMKYGGVKAYRQVMPFFLGLVLGESLIAGIWMIVGMLTNTGCLLVLPG